MKILVLSDSHSSLSFMRQCIRKLRPQHVIHLGDHMDDGFAMQEENPHIRFHLLPGNCDHNRAACASPVQLCYDIGGVRIFMTHGHMHGVKMGEGAVVTHAKQVGAEAVLYGHTHIPVCCQDGDFWIINPGSCRGYDGSCCLMEIENKKISACRLYRQTDLDEIPG